MSLGIFSHCNVFLSLLLQVSWRDVVEVVWKSSGSRPVDQQDLPRHAGPGQCYRQAPGPGLSFGLVWLCFGIPASGPLCFMIPPRTGPSLSFLGGGAGSYQPPGSAVADWEQLTRAAQKNQNPDSGATQPRNQRVKKMFLGHFLRPILKPISSLLDHFGIVSK